MQTKHTHIEKKRHTIKINIGSDEYWGVIGSTYSYELRYTEYNENYGSSFTMSCFEGGTPGSIRTCVTNGATCNSNLCKLKDTSATCKSSSFDGNLCQCSQGYIATEFICWPYPTVPNCTTQVNRDGTVNWEWTYPNWNGKQRFRVNYYVPGIFAFVGFYFFFFFGLLFFVCNVLLQTWFVFNLCCVFLCKSNTLQKQKKNVFI